MIESWKVAGTVGTEPAMMLAISDKQDEAIVRQSKTPSKLPVKLCHYWSSIRRFRTLNRIEDVVYIPLAREWILPLPRTIYVPPQKSGVGASTFGLSGEVVLISVFSG